MTYAEMREELKRVAVFVGLAETDEEADRRKVLADELFRKFSYLDPSVWREVVTWVVDHHAARRLPYVREFGEALASVRSRPGMPQEGYCGACANQRFVPHFVRRRSDGLCMRAVRNCVQCNPSWMLKDGLVEISRAEYEAFITGKSSTFVSADWCENEAKLLTPQAAQKILTLGDAMPKFSDSVMRILLEIAGQETVSPLPKK